MSAWAAPGVECVCLKKTPWRHWGAGKEWHGPAYKELCVVSRVFGVNGFTFLELEGYAEAYEVHRFRPLIGISQAQDVAKFRHLLTPSPIDAGLVPAGVELVE